MSAIVLLWANHRPRMAGWTADPPLISGFLLLLFPFISLSHLFFPFLKRGECRKLRLMEGVRGNNYGPIAHGAMIGSWASTLSALRWQMKIVVDRYLDRGSKPDYVTGIVKGTQQSLNIGDR